MGGGRGYMHGAVELFGGAVEGPCRGALLGGGRGSMHGAVELFWGAVEGPCKGR